MPEEWVKSDERRYSTVVSPDGKLAISVASGSEETGLKHATPADRSRKGPRTAACVTLNAQPDLWPESLHHPRIKQDRITWLLVFFVTKDEVRAELLKPVDIDENGHITGWVARRR